METIEQQEVTVKLSSITTCIPRAQITHEHLSPEQEKIAQTSQFRREILPNRAFGIIST